MVRPFAAAEFEDLHACVSWRGMRLDASGELDGFLNEGVRARFDDTAGTEEFQSHLRGLTLTGMGSQCLEEVLAAEVSEEREWAAGEALAEAYLETHHGVVFPWNMERDKRNPFGSLPGADLVGFIEDGVGLHRLVLGEVKCSTEEKYPPQVMSGRSGGIGHQLDRLATDLGLLCQLLKWLHPRVRGTGHEAAFNASCIAFFNSATKSITLFGVLVRDTKPNEKDVSGRGKALRKTLGAPTTCDLIGLYLPWPISQLPTEIRKGGAA